ncbi:MAG TPA: hypothetical protein VKM55_08685 [Candidatus Lokiarchaeia archaeon]|nr:hypothetical protein [Candidatus Lokiarchaeia archaeon]
MIPRIKLEDLDISRLVCGTNAFCGISHFTISRDMFLRDYLTVDRIVEIMTFIQQEFGVNALISSPRDHIYEAIQRVQKETGEKFHWICTPSSVRETATDLPPTMAGQVQWCADHEVSVCMPHRSYTDAKLDTMTMEIEGIEEILADIRDHGMIPGLSTHFHNTIRICDHRKYDVKLIVQPLNVQGFQSDIEVNTLITVIKNTKIQVLNIKPMAAGRIEPEIGLNFSLNNIKDNDFVACGFSCIQDADYDCQLVDRILNKKQ